MSRRLEGMNSLFSLLGEEESVYFKTDLGILYCADCLQILSCMPHEVFDLVVTDPPYGVGVREGNGIRYTDEFYDVDAVSKLLFKVLKHNSRCFIFSAQKTLFKVVESFESAGFKLHQIIVWYKPNLVNTNKKVFDFRSTHEFILNFHKGSPPKLNRVKGLSHIDVLTYPQPQSNFKFDKRFHVNQKPLKLIQHLLLAASSKGQLVLDCFAGSGTTLVAAQRLGVRWVGIEINSEYCEIAKKRILAAEGYSDGFYCQSLFKNMG
jgi:DNA modification methylase